MSEKSVDPTLFATAKDGVLDLILAESDKRVAAQVQLMLAADTRAAGILSGCVALAAAAIGFAISQLAHREPVFWAAIAFGLSEAIGGVMALWALWPEQVDPQGWAPAMFNTDIGKTKAVIQAEIAKYLQRRIVRNRESARKLSGRIKAAMLFGALGPLAGLSAALWAADLPGPATAFSVALLSVFVWLGPPLIPGAARILAER